MSVLDSVLAYKAKRDAEAAADVMAIPSAINTYTTSKQNAEDNLLKNLVTQATLAKTSYEIQDLASKAEARKNIPNMLSQFGIGPGQQQGDYGFTGATIDPESGDMKYNIGETPQAKDRRELAQEEAKINLKKKVPSAQQQQDLTEAKGAKSLLDQMEVDSKKLPSGYGAIWQNIGNFFTRGNSNPKLVTYNDTRPAAAVGLYRALTGDKRLSDADAKARALPLMWDSDEGDKVRTEKFSKLKRMAEARIKLVQEGKYTVDENGQYITPLTDLEEAAKSIDATTSNELPEGVTEDDIAYTMKKHKLSREEVLERLG